VEIRLELCLKNVYFI